MEREVSASTTLTRIISTTPILILWVDLFCAQIMILVCRYHHSGSCQPQLNRGGGLNGKKPVSSIMIKQPLLLSLENILPTKVTTWIWTQPIRMRTATLYYE